jgi:serine/threonine-protein kinase
MISEQYPALLRSLYEVRESRLTSQNSGSVEAAALERLGYDSLERIGSGGTGTVFKVRRAGCNQVFAVKLLRTDWSHLELARQRFSVEGHIGRSLNHRNIVRTLGFGITRGVSYIIMEYVTGSSLDRLLEKNVVLGEAMSLAIVRQIAEGLCCAWRRHRVIHRDIKPQNIMLTPRRVAKICDFGLSKNLNSDSDLTLTGNVGGTPTHISPEQARKEKLDCRTDIYSLGITFFQCVTGVLPFTGNSPYDYAIKHATAPRVPPASLNQSISKQVSDLILQMIEPDRERRPQTPAEVARAIGVIQAQSSRGTKVEVGSARSLDREIGSSDDVVASAAAAVFAAGS